MLTQWCFYQMLSSIVSLVDNEMPSQNCIPDPSHYRGVDVLGNGLIKNQLISPEYSWPIMHCQRIISRMVRSLVPEVRRRKPGTAIWDVLTPPLSYAVSSTLYYISYRKEGAKSKPLNISMNSRGQFLTCWLRSHFLWLNGWSEALLLLNFSGHDDFFASTTSQIFCSKLATPLKGEAPARS